MSRCLPFPPPNYMKNGIGGEALLQQLELRRVKYCEEKKEEKKQKKRDKKSEEDDEKSKRSNDDKESEKDDEKSKRSNDDKESEKDDEKSKRSNDDKESEKDDKSKTSHEKKKQRRNEKMETHLEYTKLTMNWVPLQMEMFPTDLDEEWLSRKNQSNVESETKTPDQSGHVDGSSSTYNGSYQGIQPLACYLPHADIYALPYALPF